MANLFSVDAVDQGVTFVANTAWQVNKKIAETSDPEERKKYIAKWKTEAKSAIKKLTAEAKKTYTSYREFVKSYDTKYLGTPINSEAISKLMKILSDARDAEEIEKRNSQYKITLLLKDIRWFFGISNTEFDKIKNSIQSCFLDLQSEYNQFQMFARKTAEEIQNNPNISSADQAVDSLDKFSRDLSKLQGEKSGIMYNRIKELQEEIGRYTAKKMEEMDYAFNDIQKKVKETIANNAKMSSPEEAPKPEAVANLTTSEFMTTLPNTLIFFKILASIAGVRSKGIAVDPEDKKKYGKYGNGLFAKIGFTIEEHMEGQIEAFDKRLKAISQKKIENVEAMKALTWD